MAVSVKSMKTSTVTAMKAMKRLATGKGKAASSHKTTAGKTSSPKETNISCSSSVCKAGGAVLALTTALYLASVSKSTSQASTPMDVRVAGFANLNGTLPNTTKLANCGYVAMPSKAKVTVQSKAAANVASQNVTGHSETYQQQYKAKYQESYAASYKNAAKAEYEKASSRVLETLTEQHSKLGFSVAELLENMARPLETEFLALAARNSTEESCEDGSLFTNDTNATMPLNGTNATMPLNGTNATMPLNGTDATSNSTSSLTGFVDACRVGLRMSLTAFSSTLANSFVNATSDTQYANPIRATCEVAKSFTTAGIESARHAYNATKCAVKSAFTGGKNTTRSVLTTKFDQLFDKQPRGAKTVLMAVKQAVSDVKSIFRDCVAGKGDVVAVAKRFPSSHVANVAPAKFVYNTVVSDGWSMEVRETAGLWTNVSLGRGDFVLMLQRDTIGAVRFFVNGVEVGAA